MSEMFVLPYQAIIDDNTEEPELIAGGALYFYDPGTTTARTVYSDSALTTAHSQPVEADSAGRFPPIYLPVGDFKVVLKDDVGGNTIWTADNVPGKAADADDLTTALPDTPVLSKVANYTVLAADIGSVINCNPTSASFTITLLSAVTATDGQRITLRHVGTANQVLIVTASSQTISKSNTGVTTTAFSLTDYGESVTLVSDGANWHVVSHVPGLIHPTTGVIVIIDRITAAPGSPVNGGRYLVTASYSTFETHDIIEYTGQTGTYIEYTPATDCGWIAYVQDEDINYQFRGSAWVPWWAVQADQETGTSLLLGVTPGVQHFHDSACKVWAITDVAGGIQDSYNVTSIADTGTGQMTATIATDFSSANFCALASPQTSAVNSGGIATISSQAAGSVVVSTYNISGPALSDPTARFNVAAFGDI